MRTDLSAWLVGVAALFLLWGIITREPRIFALIIPMVVYLALGTALGSDTHPPQVRLTRRVEKEKAIEGEELTVSLEVENLGRSLELLEVFDRLPPQLEVVEGSRYMVTRLRRREVVEREYTVRLRAPGRHFLGPIVLRSRDLPGFFFHTVVEEDTVAVVATPTREDLRRTQLPARRMRTWLGQIPSRSPGLGTDFWSIRDYVSGDEMRRINWKASARLNSLFTNELEAERSGDFVLILDAREEVASGPIHETAVVMGVRAAMSLAEMLLDARNRVGLITMRAVLDWVYPASGRRQFLDIVESLVSVKPGGQWSLKHLPWILGRFFPAGSHLIIISPMVDASTRDAILEMKARGFDALVLSLSAVDLEMRHATDDEMTRAAYSILKLEREANLGLLRRFARVADWRPGEPLALALKEVERRMPLRP